MCEVVCLLFMKDDIIERRTEERDFLMPSVDKQQKLSFAALCIQWDRILDAFWVLHLYICFHFMFSQMEQWGGGDWVQEESSH